MRFGSRSTAQFEWALAIVGLVASSLVLPHRLGYDGQIRFGDIETLIHEGTLSDSPYSLVMPIVSDEKRPLMGDSLE